MVQNRDRFKDALWFPTQSTPVLLGGAGGIGSWLSLLLARAGFTPYIYDMDTVEAHNLSGQLYGIKDIGTSKVKATHNIILELTGENVPIFNEEYTDKSMTNNYVIAAFDNMQARQVMFKLWLDGNTDDNALYIDGRLTMEQMFIYCIRRKDTKRIEEYIKNHLQNDNEIDDTPCTLKQTSHSAAMIASHIVGFFTNHIANIALNSSLEPFDLPFLWEYYIGTNLLTVVNVEEVEDTNKLTENEENTVTAGTDNYSS